METNHHSPRNRFLARLGKWAVVLLIPAVVIGGLAAVVAIWGPGHETAERSDELWTCSMHPQVRLPQPGPCPICGMSLIPVSQLAEEQARVEDRAGLETEPVVYRELFKEIRTVGRIDYDESRVAYITARIDGRVDRVFADFTGIQVKEGDHLVSIYSPTLFSTQAELLRSLEALERAQGDRRFLQTNLESARMKLRLLGIRPEQIEQIEKSRQELTHLTIYAPIGGVVVEKNVREQQYVEEGDMLYQIAELDPIWLYLDIYEYDLAWIRFGQRVEVTVEAYPGEVFEGTIVFIDPFLSDQTRTVKVRVNLPNPDSRLKPAMYASARIHVPLQSDGTPRPTGLEGKYICPMHPEIVQDQPGTCPICGMALEQVPDLFPTHAGVAHEAHPEQEDGDDGHGHGQGKGKVLAVRKSAVLDTGRRQIAYRKRPDRAYELVELKLGPLAEGLDASGRPINYYPVLGGLHPGDEVVIQGGFLLDSQRQIEGMPSLLYDEGRSAASLHAGHAAAGSSAPAAPTSASGAHQH